ncbi:hypothetical protein KFL_007660020 [Klebsormidium nitens]|uniref:Uncharacterized protein n=1 Tax=Klebsormidium nitens TaxID=105231 RepID=A0A1Y1IT17_KLENI|nr:hypothetical protein KFL_007660020 [Klebsormidium nitens]|eukprot:GAQ91328.1 hypothetical protein KFL_007660020 [Klebsormidium nitens]
MVERFAIKTREEWRVQVDQHAIKVGLEPTELALYRRASQMEGLPDEVARQTLFSSPFEAFQKRLRDDAGRECRKQGCGVLAAPMESEDASGLERGKKRKLHEEKCSEREQGPASAHEGSDAAIIGGAADDEGEPISPLRHQSSASMGDDCEGADDEVEETAADREMLDDRPAQQANTPSDHRRADQEREIRASEMETAACAMIAKGYVVFTADTVWDPSSKGGSGGNA